jgi:hypothetical protein
LWRSAYTNGNARADEHGFANTHIVANCDSDTGEYAYADEYCDGDGNCYSDCNGNA